MKNRNDLRHKSKVRESNTDISDEEFSELIKEQYEELMDTLVLDIQDRVRPILIPRTVLGRAQNGHGLFYGAKRPNIMQGEIYEALGMSPEKMKNRTQAMQNGLKNCIDDLFDGKIDRLINKQGNPIFGVKFLENIPLVPDKDFWRGALVSRMDMSEWREQAAHIHPRDMEGSIFKIGYGKEYPVCISQIGRVTSGRGLMALSETAHSKSEIQRYGREGLVVHSSRAGDPGIENLFIRHAIGKGVCDDAAIVSLGLFHGEGAMVLGFVIDAADTYTKYSKNNTGMGFDEYLGRHICARWKERWGEELLTPKETTDIIYFGAKNTLGNIEFSTSHRRFVEYEVTHIPDEPVVNFEGAVGTAMVPKEVPSVIQKAPTFINHLEYVKTGKEENFHLGFHRHYSRDFYKNIRRRFITAGFQHKLPPLDTR